MKMRQLMQLTFACTVLMTSACGVAPPIRDDVTRLELSKGSVGFFTMEVENVFKPDYQPKMDFVYIKQKTAKRSKTHMVKIENPAAKKKGKRSRKKADKSASNEPENKKYLVSFQLPAGDYTVENVRGMATGFLIIGSFMAPLYKDITLENNKVMYFGHVDAKILERKSDDQLRAGSVIPLIDQSVIGASGGTFSIDISDRFDQDMPLIKERYKYLGQMEIVNSTMSQWEQPSKPSRRKPESSKQARTSE